MYVILILHGCAQQASSVVAVKAGNSMPNMQVPLYGTVGDNTPNETGTTHQKTRICLLLLYYLLLFTRRLALNEAGTTSTLLTALIPCQNCPSAWRGDSKLMVIYLKTQQKCETRPSLYKYILSIITHTGRSTWAQFNNTRLFGIHCRADVLITCCCYRSFEGPNWQ